MASAAAYAGEPWAATYWREHDLASRKRYVPYVGWRRAPFTIEPSVTPVAAKMTCWVTISSRA